MYDGKMNQGETNPIMTTSDNALMAYLTNALEVKPIGSMVEQKIEGWDCKDLYNAFFGAAAGKKEASKLSGFDAPLTTEELSKYFLRK